MRREFGIIMKQLEKRMQIDDNRILIFNVSEGYAKPTITMMEGFLKNGDLIKTYSLSQWDDYGLNGWVNNDEDLDKISFEFDKSHPLFLPLFHLLDYDDELLIDDDDSQEDNKKYLLVHRKEDKIYMDFIDELGYSFYTGERFHVFIKNILFDGRSKIDRDQKDTKERLLTFFNEAYDEIMGKYHQIDFEEYLLLNRPSEEIPQLKRVFKRKMY